MRPHNPTVPLQDAAPTPTPTVTTPAAPPAPVQEEDDQEEAEEEPLPNQGAELFEMPLFVPDYDFIMEKRDPEEVRYTFPPKLNSKNSNP